MTISAIEINSAVNVLTKQNAVKAEPAKAACVSEISDKYSVSDEAQKFKEITGKYDITSISRNEMREMSQDLYDNGLISLKELGFMTFDPSRLGDSIEQATGIKMGNSITVGGWKMSTDPNQKMNFLEGFKTKAEYNEKHGNPVFQKNFDMMADLAEKIKYFQS